MLSLDIERLLHWVYRDEIPKASRRSASPASTPSAWDIVERHLTLGCRVDVSSQGARHAIRATHDGPHDDALIVERMVDNLRRNVLVDWPKSAAALLGDLAGLAGDKAPAVARYTFNEFALVESCATAGARPSWHIGRPQMRPACGRNGKPELVGKRFASARYSVGAQCPIEWHSPSVDQVLIARATYSVWHAGLARLASDLKGKLSAHNALPPAAPAMPWNSRVLPTEAAA